MSRKILLADDSVTIQKVVSITLAHEDIDLTIVDNGAEAFAKAQQLKPDIILLDVVMPDKDGYQVCEQIKQIPGLSHIPIILLTGTFEPFDEEKAEQVGANDYIKKPFESHALINKIKEMSFRGAGAHTASPTQPERDEPVDSGDSSEFIMGDETEIGLDAITPSQTGAELSGFDTPQESKPRMETPREAPLEKKKSEDIWSVEEFEDIAGPSRDEADLTPVVEEPDPWGDVTISTDSVPAEFDIGPDHREPISPSRDAGEFFQADDIPQMNSGDFELGEEISEDELSQFLDEEELEVNIKDEAISEVLSTPPLHKKTEADVSFDEMGIDEGAPTVGDDFNMKDFDEPLSTMSTPADKEQVFQLSDDDVEIPLEEVEDISLGDGVDIPTEYDDDFSLGDEIQVPGDLDDVSADELSAADDSFSLDDVDVPPEFRDDFTLENVETASDEGPDLADKQDKARTASGVDFIETIDSETSTIFDEIETTATPEEDDMFVPDDAISDTDFLWEKKSREEAASPFEDDIGAETVELDMSFSESNDEFEDQHRFESTRMSDELHGDSGFGVQKETAQVDEQLISRAMEEVSSRVSGSMSEDLSGVEPGTEEYDQAVNKIAREVIEKVAWEVVPELAEVLIKEEIQRLKGEKG